MTVQLTQHGAQRLKERSNKKGTTAALQYAQKALERGKNIADFSKETQTYLINVLKNSRGDLIKVYANQIFLFGGNNLITTYPMQSKVLQKEHRRKLVKFYPNNDYADDEREEDDRYTAEDDYDYDDLYEDYDIRKRH